MKYIINETGKKTKLLNMSIIHAEKTQNWGNHLDRLYADYDFPILNNKDLSNWYINKTSNNKVLISILDFEDNLIGYISLRKINLIFKTAEIGIVLDPNKINMGYGSDAIYVLKKWFFRKIKFKTLYLSVAMYNLRAYHTYKKLGFVEIKTFWDKFENLEINPLEDEIYTNIRKYFKRKFDDIYVKCIKMKVKFY